MATLAEFQQQFGARIRDPDRAALPSGVPPRRMAIYEELLHNNLEGFLNACYPVTRQLFAKRWPRLLRAFLCDARCRSPLFRDIPREFLDWLERDGALRLRLPRWATALAHYEWAELAVDVMDGIALPHDPHGDLLAGVPLLAPALNLSYAWPVHRIGPAWQPRKPAATHLLVFRDAADTVGFVELNPVSARLIALIQEGQPGRDACLQVAAEIRHPEPQAVVKHGAGVLNELRNLGALIGTRK